MMKVKLSLFLSLLSFRSIVADNDIYLTSNLESFIEPKPHDDASLKTQKSLQGSPFHLTLNRELWTIPDYTSPPTRKAIRATPDYYKSDKTIDYAREVDATGSCSLVKPLACQIPFYPHKRFDESTTKLGVIFNGGALVDPRSYSPIAKKLSDEYGLYVTMPIYNNDLQFTSCDTGERVELARLAFPMVEKWILAGHSFGGIQSMVEVWNAITAAEENDSESDIGGLVMLAAYVRDLDCVDSNDQGYTLRPNFTNYDLPAASVSGSVDLLATPAKMNPGRERMNKEHTFMMDINGGNHQQYGSYDDSGRREVLGQIDGNSTITEDVQIDLAVSAIAHVVSRAGIPMPSKKTRGRTKKKSKKKNKKQNKKR